jgi:hypothetical protein
MILFLLKVCKIILRAGYLLRLDPVERVAAVQTRLKRGSHFRLSPSDIRLQVRPEAFMVSLFEGSMKI